MRASSTLVLQWSVCCLLAVIYRRPGDSRVADYTGTEVGHVTGDSDTTFKVKRSNANLRGRGTLWRPPGLFVKTVSQSLAGGSSCTSDGLPVGSFPDRSPYSLEN